METNKIYLGNCMEVLKQIEDESVDLVCTDPPYKKVQGGCTNHKVTLSGATKEDLSKGRYFDKNMIKFEEWIPEMYRVLKDGTHCYIMSDDRNLRDVLNVAVSSGFKLLNILTWKKDNCCPNRYYMNNSEFICLFRKGKARNINNMGTKRVLEFNNVKVKTHPTEKPVDLLNVLVCNSSNEGELVLDPFSGSGSLAESCIKNNRKFICIEQDKKYYDISMSRLNQI